MAPAHVDAHVDLIAPRLDALPSYLDSLRRGWSSAELEEDAAACAEELAQIDADPERFVTLLNDPMRGGALVTLPDGTTVERLPEILRWMWDGEYCGRISFRWRPGTTELPPTCLGHIGYGVVPWKRRNGYATEALAQMLVIAQDSGLPYVDITTDPENVASQSVIRANGGVLVETFEKPAVHGGGDALLFRVDLTLAAAGSTSHQGT